MLKWFNRAIPRAPEIPNFLEIARTVINFTDPRYPEFARLGERGARKAALAASGAFQITSDPFAWIDTMEASIGAQYASRAYSKETRRDWIEVFQKAA